MRIGFIGLGTMGGAAALNLIKGGHQLTVCDLDSERAKQHLELGATWAGVVTLTGVSGNDCRNVQTSCDPGSGTPSVESFEAMVVLSR